MNHPDIKLYKLDLSGVNTDNLVTREYRSKTIEDDDFIFVPRWAPFYHKGVKLTNAQGQSLDYGKDWDFYGLCGKLTAFTKDKSTGIFIRILNKKLTEWYVTYQVVGNFNIINEEVIEMFEDAINNDTPLLWKNIKDKPLWFVPSIHSHDLAHQFHSFQDIILQVLRVDDAVKNGVDKELGAIEAFKDAIDQYILNFKTAMIEIISNHDNEKVAPRYNSHGLTAKAMGLEKVDNFKTATLLQTLDGIRTDLHITADNALKAVKEAKGTSSSLFPSGVLPVLRYGSNNFIPPSIDGSFEGLGGGEQWRFGINKESDGTHLILTNRANGKVNGLYFMRTNDPTNPDTWKFTGYQYKHPTADNLNIDLTSIINGSSGKMVMVGNNAKQEWFWAKGNGTLNPNKHTLHKLDKGDGTLSQEALTASSIGSNVTVTDIVTFAESDRILFVRAFSLVELQKWFPEISIEYANENTNLYSYFAEYWDRFAGFRVWEFNQSNETWEPIWFNYTRVGRDDEAPITSLVYSPYKFVGGYGNDGLNDNKYIVSEYYLKFTPSGAKETGHARVTHICGRDDPNNNRFALRFNSIFYVVNSTRVNVGMPDFSGGFGFTNKYYKDGKAFYKVERSKSMKKLYTFDATKSIHDTVNLEAKYNGPFMETRSRATGGARVYNDGIYYGIVSPTVTTLPVYMFYDPFTHVIGTSYQDMLDYRTTGKVLEAETTHIEETPLGIGVNPIPIGYIQLDSKNPNSLYSVFKSNVTTGKNYQARLLTALNSNNKAIAPNVNYNFITATGVPYVAKGYSLSNDVKAINYNYNYGLISKNFEYSVSPDWNDIYFSFSSMHKDNVLNGTANISAVNINNVGFLYPYKVKPVVTGSEINFDILEYIDIEKLIKDIIIPNLIEFIKTDSKLNGLKYNTNNLPSRWTIAPFPYANNKIGFVIIFYLELSNGNTRAYSNTLSMDSFEKVDSLTKKCTKATLLSKWDSTIRGAWQQSTADNYLKDESSIAMNRANNNGINSCFTQIVYNERLNGAHPLMVIFDSHSYSTTGDRFVPTFICSCLSTGELSLRTEPNIYYSNPAAYVSPHPYYGIVKYTGYDAMGGAGVVCNPYNVDGKDDTLYRAIVSKNNFDVNQYLLCDSNLINQSFTVYYQSDETVMLAGKNYQLKSGFKDLYDINPDPKNKTFYLYVKFVLGNPEYQISEYPLPETSSQAFVATIKTDSYGISQIVPNNVFTMNGYRISQERRGGSIPASTGTIVERGELSGWKNFN